MTQIGALCYSNLFMYREDLKAAILAHPSWLPSDPTKPHIFDLFINEFISNGKKSKMIFVSAKQSKTKETADLFKQLYDGSPKTYQNSFMMLFIPLIDGHQPTPKF
jgi:primase-polymerase (primpol)-like protein